VAQVRLGCQACERAGDGAALVAVGELLGWLAASGRMGHDPLTLASPLQQLFLALDRAGQLDAALDLARRLPD
jgi:hypothetical protein